MANLKDIAATLAILSSSALVLSGCGKDAPATEVPGDEAAGGEEAAEGSCSGDKAEGEGSCSGEADAEGGEGSCSGEKAEGSCSGQ